MIDSVLAAGSELGPGSLAMECLLEILRARRSRSVLHGLEDIRRGVEVPEDVVAHQGAVILPDGTPGIVIRVYGVGDDPKLPAATGEATGSGTACSKNCATSASRRRWSGPTCHRPSGPSETHSCFPLPRLLTRGNVRAG